MIRRYLLCCGLLAALVYVGAVILGGLLRPGYSHIAYAISELIATGAPNTALLIPLFTLYDTLLTDAPDLRSAAGLALPARGSGRSAPGCRLRYLEVLG